MFIWLCTCREKGYERQYRYLCTYFCFSIGSKRHHSLFLTVGTRCTLPIGYQLAAPPTKSEFVYLNYGAMTQQQGHVPPEAFSGEEEVHERLAARRAVELVATES